MLPRYDRGDEIEAITITIRSYVPFYEPGRGFDLGEPFTIEVPLGITIREIVQNILSISVDQIGIIVVNGVLAKEDATVSQGDTIDLYALLDGG